MCVQPDNAGVLESEQTDVSDSARVLARAFEQHGETALRLQLQQPLQIAAADTRQRGPQ